MTISDREFIERIREEVIATNLESYRELFAQTRPQSTPDLYWKKALQFFHQLDDSGQEVFFSIIRQVMVDTASSIFGIFDGVSNISGQVGAFEVRIGEQNLAGSLQDLFLAAEEDDLD
jgi:hypothetical protein